MAGFLSLRPPPCKEHPTHFHQTTPPVLLSQEGLLLSEIIVFVSPVECAMRTDTLTMPGAQQAISKYFLN